MSTTRITSVIAALILLVNFAGPWPAIAGDGSSELRFKDGRFEPPLLTLPAGKPTELQVTNSDSAAFEFESFELHRERVVQPGQTITVYLPALDPGSYPFFDDVGHRANGRIVAR